LHPKMPWERRPGRYACPCLRGGLSGWKQKLEELASEPAQNWSADLSWRQVALVANRHQLSVELSCPLAVGDLQTEVGYSPPHEEPMNGPPRERRQRLEDHLDGSISRHIGERHTPRPRQ
jgi:hypothetical protein